MNVDTTESRPLPLVDARTLRDLDFPRIQAALAQRAQTSVGRARCAGMTPLPDTAGVRHQLAAVAELLLVTAEDANWPDLGGVRDVEATVRMAERGGTLDASQFIDIAGTLGTGERAVNWCVARRELAPSVAARVDAFGDHAPLVRLLEKSFERSGRLADHASPTLGELRRRVAGMRETLAVRMEQLVREFYDQGLLQDTFHTLREDRYVLPVKAHERWRVQGIVHDTSQTHQTFFIEPQEVVDLGNRLKAASADVDDEEQRILRQLSAEVGRRAREIILDLASLHVLDVLVASARLGADLGGRVPILSRPDGEGAPGVALRAFRHPVLLLDAIGRGETGTVVANDLFAGTPPVLVISGPNTGGKTVALKGVGLCAAMARTGLPIPVAADSVVPLYDRLHAVVGDGQSLEDGLSSFAAHLRSIREMLEGVSRAAAGRQSVLCVLDEIMAGTDPDQGAALAQAVLEDLARAGAHVVATTHFEKLKAPGLDPALMGTFRNAAVGLDPRTLTPTWRLAYDTPGASSALDMAAMLGMPARITDRARELSSEQGRRLEDLLKSLSARGVALDEERAAVAHAHEEAALARDEAQAARDELVESEKELRRRARAGMLEETRRARAELQDAIAATRTALRDAERTRDGGNVETALGRLQAVGELHDRLARQDEQERRDEAAARKFDAPLGAGSRVHVLTLGVEGEVLEVGPRDALVAAGALRLRVALKDLAPPARARAVAAPPPPRRLVPPAQAAPSTLDLRGERVDDALERLGAFLDHALSGADGPLIVVHGHGTGALRTAVRDALSHHPAVSSHRRGNDEEGGNGVTVVLLKET